MTETAPTVTEAPDKHRFEIVENGELAGLADYMDTELGGAPVRIFHHTEVGKKFGGRGLAGILVEYALRQTQATGRRIVPVCSYVENFVAKHPEFGKDVDEVSSDALAAVQAGPKTQQG